MQLEINGREFDAIDVEIFGLGAVIRGAASASYSFTRTHTNQYAIGSDEPVQYSMGVKAYESGTFALYMREIVAIEFAKGGDKDVTKIKPFKTYFTYTNDDGSLVTDEVTWKFSNWGRTVNIEGTGEAREFAMHVISIRPNIPR